jgi:hypothetical protein
VLLPRAAACGWRGIDPRKGSKYGGLRLNVPRPWRTEWLPANADEGGSKVDANDRSRRDVTDVSETAAPAATANDRLRSLARDSFLPRLALARIALGLVLAKPLLVWLLPRVLLNEPLAVTAMYRPSGDIQYYEMIAAVARGNLGESNIVELAHQGIQSFPVVPVLLHSVGLATLGIWGMLVADLIGAWLFFGALVLLLRVSRIGPSASALIALAVAASLPAAINAVTDRVGLPYVMWGDRVPRPYIAELFLVGAFAMNACFVRCRDRPPGAGFWAVAGLTAGFLVQSDPYGGFVLLCLHGATLLAILLQAGGPARRAWLRGVAVGAVCMVAVIIPFALQRMGADPDVARRYGAFPISRLTALSWIREAPILPPLAVVAAGLALLAARRRAGESARLLAWSDEIGLLVLSWMAATTIAWLALPLFCAILGQGIQIYHFLDRLTRVSSYALTVVSAHAVLLALARSTWLQGLPHRLGVLRHAAPVAAGVVMLASLGAIGLRAWTNARRVNHVRSTYFPYDSVAPYRPAFAELVTELQKPSYRGVDVLATLDHQVHVVWHSFLGGHSFVPDLFVTTVSDEYAEGRLAALCKLLGMSEDQFIDFVQERWVNTFWLGVTKYAANSAYMMSSANDYEPEQVATARSKGIFNAWNLAVPRSELERLRATYRQVEPAGLGNTRLDAVVLTNDPELAPIAPDPTRFHKTFENRMFRLYLAGGG